MKLPAFWNEMPESIRARFGQKGFGRQRAMSAERSLLLVLHKPPKAGSSRRDAALFWRRPDGRWEASQSGDGLTQLRRHLEDFETIGEGLSDRCLKGASSEDYFNILTEGTPLLHAARNMHLTLQTAREQSGNDKEIIDLRDKAYEIERFFELLCNDARHGIELHSARQAEEEAKLARHSLEMSNRLNILAALAFPLIAISGLFGMNLSNGFEKVSPTLFWLVFMLCCGMGVMTCWWMLRSPGNSVQRRNSGGRHPDQRKRQD